MIRSVLVMDDAGIQAEECEWVDAPALPAYRAAAIADEPTPILDVRRSFPRRRRSFGRRGGEVLSFGRPAVPPSLPWPESVELAAPMPANVDTWDDEEEITEILGLDVGVV